MTQAPSVYGDLTVRENLRYFARVLGVAGGVDRARSRRSGSTSTRTRVVDRLSGGQRARVSLATALLGRPELLVLDEPTVGLDPVLRRELWDAFHALAEDGATLLVSSHVMDEADRCDELLLLRDGGLLARRRRTSCASARARATSTTRSCASSRRRAMSARVDARDRRARARRSCATTRARSR